MSKPILYSPTENSFDSNGIGILNDCISCFVTEEANGIYELEMKYPMDGIHYSKISDRCLIKSKPNNDAKPQIFRVYLIKKSMSGVASIYAKHISYDLSGIPVSMFTADNAPSAMMGLSQNAVVDCPFVFMTDKTTVANFSVKYPGSIRSKLGGSSGSILDVYGGEYEFDNYNVILHNKRGKNRGVSIRYGKNLTDIQQERNCGSVATGVYPYWLDSESEKVIELPEKIVNVDGTYSFSKIKMLELSDAFTSNPTESEIRSYTESYIKNNNVGIPDVSLSVSFNQLEQSEEYKGLELLEKVSLFDTVNVEFPALGVSATAKAVKVIYDVIMERVESVTLGSVKANIADTLANQQQQIEQVPSKNYVQNAANAASAVATAWLTNGKGYKVERRDENGNTVDTLYMDTPDINTAVNVLRIGQSGIGFSKSGADGPYYSAWTIDGRFNADFIRAGSIKSNDEKSVIIDLDKGTASLKGSLTAESENRKSALSAGRLSMYYDNGLRGFLSSTSWNGAPGMAIYNTNQSKIFAFYGQNPDDPNYYLLYALNLGANPSDHTERHIFYDTVRFRSVANHSSNVVLENGVSLRGCETDGTGRSIAFINANNNLMFGNNTSPVFLLGDDVTIYGNKSVTINNLKTPVGGKDAANKEYVDSSLAPKLGRMRLLTSADDCNNITDDGVYWYSTSSVPKNAPFQNAAVMLVFGNDSTTTQKIQFGFRYGSAGYGKFRPLYNTWQPWAEFAVATDGIVAVENGGTGASTAEAARANIGAAPAGCGYGDTMTFYNVQDGTFEATMDGLLEEMPSNSARQIQFIDKVGLSVMTYQGTLWKYTATYAVLTATSYAGTKAIKVKQSGTWGGWEFQNPGTVAGTENPTMERYNHKTVYTKLIDFGALPNATSKTVAHGLGTDATIISFEVFTNKAGLVQQFPFMNTSGANSGKAHLTNYSVVITTQSDLTAYTDTKVLIKYIKN